MQCVLKTEREYVIRFDSGEEVISGIADFCAKEKILGASFSAIGAAERVTLAYYKLHEKAYQDYDLEERLEIAGLLGTVAILNGEQIVHAHGVFSNRHYTVRAGHIKKLVVSATCEVSLRALNGELKRKFDERTGLNLLEG